MDFVNYYQFKSYKKYFFFKIKEIRKNEKNLNF